jgi:hypothetical protein
MGRPPKDENDRLSGFVRQRRYVRARKRQAAEIARALRVMLADKAAIEALKVAYPTGSDQRQLLLSGLDQVLIDDQPTAKFFERLFKADKRQ